jgi:hypothetical protein
LFKRENFFPFGHSKNSFHHLKIALWIPAQGVFVLKKNRQTSKIYCYWVIKTQRSSSHLTVTRVTAYLSVYNGLLPGVSRRAVPGCTCPFMYLGGRRQGQVGRRGSSQSQRPLPSPWPPFSPPSPSRAQKRREVLWGQATQANAWEEPPGTSGERADMSASASWLCHPMAHNHSDRSVQRGFQAWTFSKTRASTHSSPRGGIFPRTS